MTDEKLFEITEKLLEEVKDIQEKYEEKLRKNTSKFNIFEITRINHLETRMSFFLCELLNKNGTHCMGTIYLKQFFKDVLTLNTDDDELEKTDIRCQEKEHTDDGREKRIDMVILTPYRYLPIEIKVNASEGENQCYDYFRISEKENQKIENGREWGLFYLTPYGSEPESTKNLEESRKKLVHSISWKEHIALWLENLIKLTPASRNNALEIIKQYKQAIEHLTGQNKESIQMKLEDIVNNSKTMKASEIIKAAVAIREATPDKSEIRTNLVKKMFQEIDECFKKTHTNEKIDDNYDEAKYPSLVYAISDEIEKYILVVRFEIYYKGEKSCYVGFTVSEKTENGYKSIEFNSLLLDVKEKIKKLIPSEKLNEMKATNWWLGLLYAPDFGKKPMENTPDFKNFNQAFYDLFDDNKRKIFVEKIVEKISELASWVENNNEA